MALPKMPNETYIDVFIVDRLILVDLADSYEDYQQMKTFRKGRCQPGVMKTDIDPKLFQKTKEMLQKMKEVADTSRSRSTSTSSTSVTAMQLSKTISGQLEAFLRNSHYSTEYRNLRAVKCDEVIPTIEKYVIFAMLPKSPCKFEFR